MPWPHDAAGRHASYYLVRAAILGRQRVAIGTARATGDMALVVAGLAGGCLPAPVVGHRTFDREHAAVVVGDNQVERRGWSRGMAHFTIDKICYRRPSSEATQAILQPFTLSKLGER
jgi:hypothetical protein